MNKNFLSKKSWHTSSLKNIEKVWVAEKKYKDEESKMTILKKELEEERKIMELKNIQKEATGKPFVQRLEWMYTIKKGPTTEEYLMGKPIVPSEQDKELDQLTKKPGSLWANNNNNINPAQDTASKIKDDPLLTIKKQEQKVIKGILDNPVKMKHLKESKEIKKLIKKLKKEKKKDKLKKSDKYSSDKEYKKDKKRKHSRSRSPSPKTSSHKKSHSPKTSSHKKSPSPVKYSSKNYNSEDHHKNYHHHSSNHFENNYRRNNKKKISLTEEEKQKRLAEMEQDAISFEERKLKRIKLAEEEERKENTQEKKKHAKFLDEINKNVYTEHNENLEDRVKRNIHYIQRKTGDSLMQEETGII